MEHVESFLNSLGLGQYVPAFESNGYDQLDIIFEHEGEDFDIFGRVIGMLPGHLHRLKKAVQEIQDAGASTPQSTVPRVPIIPLVGRTTATGHDGPAACAATAACAAAAPTPDVVTATKRKRPHHDLPEYCKTAKEVRVESLRHSTALGSSAMRDNSSGKRKIVYRCKSMLSKRLRKKMGPDVDGYKCDHCLTWNWTKKNMGGCFKLNKETSVLEHSPRCVTTQQVSRTELLHDADFVKHALNKLDSTGAQAAKIAVGRGGRLDGSVSSRTAKRASNDVKRFHDKDYQEDWSKLGPWGEDYERLNNAPGASRFDMMVDDQNRSVIGPKGPLVCRAQGASGV